MHLTNQDIEALHKALLSAYPDLEELEMMLFFKLGLAKSDIGGGTTKPRTFVFNLITKAVADGTIKQLIIGAHDDNPGNVLLEQFYQKHISTQETAVAIKMFQLQNLYKSQVRPIAQEMGVDDFEATPNENKLRVYKVMIGLMFNNLGSQTFSEEQFGDIKIGLNEAINGFFYLLNGAPSDDTDTFQLIIEKLMEANANLLAAITALQACRMKLFEALKPLSDVNNSEILGL